MLETLDASAAELGLEVETVRTEAERLPFADESFDLVFGHAILHHIPDLERAFSRVHRVLRPGGTVAFCGEPSRYGDRIAALPKRAGLLAAPAWRRVVGASAASWVTEGAIDDGHELESEVDVHAFAPADLRRRRRRGGLRRGPAARRGAGRERLRLAAAHARGDAPSRPRCRLAGATSPSAATSPCSASTRRCSSPGCPPELFYNLVLSARKPQAA